MVAHRSVFDPQNNDDGPIRGGLDRFLGPPAQSYSHMPGDLIDGQTDDESDPQVEDPEAGRFQSEAAGDPERGDWSNPDEPVQQIREALDEKYASHPTTADDTDSYPAD